MQERRKLTRGKMDALESQGERFGKRDRMLKRDVGSLKIVGQRPWGVERSWHRSKERSVTNQLEGVGSSIRRRTNPTEMDQAYDEESTRRRRITCIETIQRVGVGWCGIAREPTGIASEIRTQKLRGIEIDSERDRERVRLTETEREIESQRD